MLQRRITSYINPLTGSGRLCAALHLKNSSSGVHHNVSDKMTLLTRVGGMVGKRDLIFFTFVVCYFSLASLENVSFVPRILENIYTDVLLSFIDGIEIIYNLKQ